VTAVAESVLIGDQVPRISSVPPYSVSLGDQAVAFAAKAGLFLDPWQQLVLRESMGMAPGGKWAAPRVGLLVPRQNGKGSVLEALELFHLFVLGTKLIIHSAHKFDTSQEHFLRMRTLIEGNPDLSRHVRATPTANGKEAIILNNGNRLKFKARTISGAGRGFSADLLILDEAMLLPEAGAGRHDADADGPQEPAGVVHLVGRHAGFGGAVADREGRPREGSAPCLLRVGLRVRHRRPGPAELGAGEPGAWLPDLRRGARGRPGAAV
jgi:hypothetical protein